MLHCVTGWVVTSVLKDCSAVIVRVKQCCIAWPWRRRRHWRPTQHWYLLTRWHGVTYQKAWIFSNSTLRTSNLAVSSLFSIIFWALYLKMIVTLVVILSCLRFCVQWTIHVKVAVFFKFTTTSRTLNFNHVYFLKIFAMQWNTHECNSVRILYLHWVQTWTYAWATVYTYTEPQFTWTGGSYRVGEESVSVVQNKNHCDKAEKEISGPCSLLGCDAV
jgi:hypothetical protein